MLIRLTLFTIGMGYIISSNDDGVIFPGIWSVDVSFVLASIFLVFEFYKNKRISLYKIHLSYVAPLLLWCVPVLFGEITYILKYKAEFDISVFPLMGLCRLVSYAVIFSYFTHLLMNRCEYSFIIKWLLLGVLFGLAQNFYVFDFERYRELPGKNVLGLSLSYIFFIGLYEVYTSRSLGRIYLSYYALGLILFVAIVLSGSKAALISLVLASSIFVTFRMKYVAKYCLFLVVFVVLFAPFLIDFVIAEVKYSVSIGSIERRIYLILSNILAGIIFPFGLGSDGSMLGQYYASSYLNVPYKEFINQDAHSALPEFFSWGGIVGFPFILFFYLRPLFTSLAKLQPTRLLVLYVSVVSGFIFSFSMVLALTLPMVFVLHYSLYYLISRNN